MDEPTHLAPTHAEPTSALAGVRRLAFAVLAVDFVVLAGLGLWLAYRYEPSSTGISNLHQILGALAVLAALVGAIATLIDSDRSGNAILPAVVILGVVAAIYITGPSLAWDRIASKEAIARPRGTAVVFKKQVGAVAIGDKTMTAKRYRSLTYLHTFALPVAVISMAGVGLWAARRRYEPLHAEPDDEDPPEA